MTYTAKRESDQILIRDPGGCVLATVRILGGYPEDVRLAEYEAKSIVDAMNAHGDPAKRMAFDEIMHRARCGKQIRKLAEQLAIHHPCDAEGPLGYMGSDDYRRLADKVCGTASVLEMLKGTANAHVNREALDEMAWHVVRAEELLEEFWIQGVLRQIEEEERSKHLLDEPIPF